MLYPKLWQELGSWVVPNRVSELYSDSLLAQASCSHLVLSILSSYKYRSDPTPVSTRAEPIFISSILCD